jgi:hypothetical protein
MKSLFVLRAKQDIEMAFPSISFGQQWPDDYASEGNVYWIGLDPRGLTSHGSVFVLGRECKTLAEIEVVAAGIQKELADAVSAAREKLQPNPAPSGFQTQVGEMRPPRPRR